MPSYVAQRAQNLLNDNRRAINGSSVLLLGVTYKANIADGRESPAVPLAQRLIRLGAEVLYHDPYVESWSVPGARRATDLLAEVQAANLVILLQNHRDYDVVALQAASRLFLDTRGVTPNGNRL
jgi:UDP-N-acetyl-D-mannosaminuronate dehydrogenase